MNKIMCHKRKSNRRSGEGSDTGLVGCEAGICLGDIQLECALTFDQVKWSDKRCLGRILYKDIRTGIRPKIANGNP